MIDLLKGGLLKKIDKYFENRGNFGIILPYWVEENNYIWTKIPLLPPNGKKEIYVYYDPDYEPPKDPFNDNSEIAFYRFNGNANDEYGNYNGIWSGNEQYDKGVWGQCVDYRSKSSSDYIVTPVIDRGGSKEFSLSFWINIKNHTGKWLSIFHLTPDGQDISSNSRQPAIWLCQSDNRKFHVRNDGISHSNIGIDTSNATLNYNQWFFVTVSITLRQIKLFLNASLTDIYNSSEDFKFNNGVVYIGDKWYDKNHLIDNLRIFNRALTDEEVQYLYNLEKPRFIKQEPEKIFEFFDDFEGDSLDTNKWDDSVAPSNYNINNSQIKMWGNFDITNSIRSIKTFNINNGIIIKSKGRISGTNNDYDLSAGAIYKDDNNYIRCVIESGSASNWYDCIFLDIKISGTAYQYTQNQKAGTEWIISKCIFTPNYIGFYPSGYNTIEVTDKDISFFGDVKIAIFSDTDDTNRFGYLDWIFVTKYLDNEPSILYSPEESGLWLIDGYKYTKRKKVIIKNNTNQAVKDYQIPIDFNQINDKRIKIVY